MDLKQILLDLGVEENKVDSAISNINKQVSKEFVPKSKYNDKAGDITSLQDKVNELEAELSNKNNEFTKLQAIKENYDSLTTEYNNYKNEVETKESNQLKSSKLRTQLKNDGYNEDIIPLLETQFDLSKLELEEDSIKGWEDVSKGIREQYGKFISQVTTTGAEPSTPPSGNGNANTISTLGDALRDKYNK